MDEEELGDEQEEWHEAVGCPACGSHEVRFIQPRYEMNVYICERCDTQFESDT